MGWCECDTQCPGNDTCDAHLGCPTYSDPVSNPDIPNRPATGDIITAEFLGDLMMSIKNSAHKRATTNDISGEPPYRNTAYLNRRTLDDSVNSGKIPSQPVDGESYNIDFNELVNEGDDIVPERTKVANYTYDFNGIIDYLSKDFKYTFNGANVTYLYDTPHVSKDDIISLNLIQRLWDGVNALITDCVCNYDTCECNSVCACNAECSCNGNY